MDFWQEAKQAEEKIKALYHDFHRHPELSGMEVRTQKRILEKLREWSIEARPCGGTGVYGIIRGEQGGHTVALRADMDALPVTEHTGLSYESENPGVMHACGHDAHMTVLLSAASILKKYEKQLKGNVVLLFQPSEEKGGGARRMIEEGVLREPAVECAAAFHVWEQETGSISCIQGPVMARPDGFRIEVRGRGGHGAAPHLSENPISVLAAMTTAIQQTVPHTISPFQSAVVNVCRLQCGDSYNVIADSGFLEGTVRTYDDKVREEILKQLRRIADSFPRAYGMEGKLSFDSGHPPTINNPLLAAKAAEILRKHRKEIKVFGEGEPSMLGEDFSYFGQQIPILFMRLGCMPKEKERCFPLHHNSFQIEESALITGTAAFCILAYELAGAAADETIENIGLIGREGMKETDKKILEIMLGETERIKEGAEI